MDPFGTDGDDTIDDNPNLTQVREWGRRQEKRAEELDKELQKVQSHVQTLESEKQQNTVKSAASEKGLTEDQLKTLLSMKPDATSEDVETFAKAVGTEAPAAEDADKAEGDEATSEDEGQESAESAPTPGFSPVGGTPVPAGPIKWEDTMAAAKRGDQAFLQRVAAEALRDPSRVELPHSEMIED